MTSPVAVLLVDDQARFRTVARSVVERTEGFWVVGEAVDGEHAVVRARELAPALVLMDINMPNTDGVTAMRRILAEAPATVVVLMSTYDLDDLPAGVLDGGSIEYVHKAELGPAYLTDVWRRHGTAVERS